MATIQSFEFYLRNNVFFTKERYQINLKFILLIRQFVKKVYAKDNPTDIKKWLNKQLMSDHPVWVKKWVNQKVVSYSDYSI